MATFDSIVIGAGVIGAGAALELAGRGSVLLLEQFRFLHEKGSSHGGSRIFRHAYEDEGHVRLAVAADALWQRIEERTGERLLHRNGSLDIGAAGQDQLAPISTALAAAGRPFEMLTGPAAAERFPAFALGAGDEALYQPDGAVVPATRAVATMLRAAATSGAVLNEREAVTAIEPGSDGIEVVTERGRYSAGRLIVAGGPWLGGLFPELSLSLRVEKQQVLYLTVGPDARPFAPYRMPVFIDRRSQPGGELYGFPLFDTPGSIKVGDHRGAGTIELKDRTFDIDEAWARATADAARELFPGLTGEIDSAVTCLYTKSPDELFIVDRHPEHPQVVLAGAGSGHAFKFGPVLGEAAAELAWEGASQHDLSRFSLARFG